MLNKTLNQDKVIMLVMIIFLIIFFLYVIIDKELIDIISFFIIGIYFLDFLIIKKK